MGVLVVGQDVFAVCGKCGDTWHVIVALETGKITKVQCKQCMGYHRYRTPKGEEAVDAEARKPARRTVAARPAKAKVAKKSTNGSSVRRRDEPLVDPDLSLPVRRYKMTESYEPGERIEHPKFGEGVVETSPGPGKVQVFFEDGRRTLAQGR